MKTLTNCISNSVLIGLLFFANCSLHSQGLLLDEERYAEVPFASPKFGNSDKDPQLGGGNLPPSYSLQEHAPSPGAQGRMASCVGWSIAHAVTIYRAQKQKNYHRGVISESMYSPAFIYNLINRGNDCSGGASIADGLDLVKNTGVCFKKTFDYTSGIGCTDQPTNTAYQEATRHKFRKVYQRIFQGGNLKVNSTKYYIAKGYPIIVGFSSIPPQRALRGQAVWSPGAHSSNNMGHAMVVVGYDTNGFTLMNSFGPSWGERGFIKIGYQDFHDYAQEAYVIEIEEQRDISSLPLGAADQIPVQLRGGIQVKKVSENQDHQTPTIQYDSIHHYYKVTSPNQLIDDKWTLQLEVPNGVYAYLFSVDDSNNIQKSMQIDAYHKDTTINLSLVDFSSKPAKASFSTSCIGAIFSYKKTDNFQELIQEIDLPSNEKIGYESLKKHWKGVIPKRKITYTPSQISFTATAKYREGFAVPILIYLK